MRRAEKGSVLLLVPAGVVVLLVLTALAVDAAVVTLAQRELVSAAGAAANDAVGAAVDDATFYRAGVIVLDPDRAAEVAAASMAARAPRGFELTGPPEVVVVGRQVCVVVTARVRHVVAPAIPGVRGFTDVTAHATATAAGDTTDEVARRAIC